MENNKEEKDIAEHPVEAPPPQGYPLADNPLQRPELQQLPVVDGGEERNASPEMDQGSDQPKECCCCSPGLGIDPCCVWYVFLSIMCMVLVEAVTCCCCCQHCPCILNRPKTNVYSRR